MTEERFAECMRSLSEGDRNALKEIYEEYLPYIYTIVFGVVQQKETAEEVTNDVFIKIWNSAAQFQKGSGHKGWLATIARHMAIDELRKSNREVLMGSSGDEEDDSGGTGIEELSEQETPGAGVEDEVVEQLSIREVLNRLKPEEREIIDMKVLSDMTFKEISEILQIPMGTVTWRYQAAIKKLRRYGYE
ncbi:MAG: RNA polymerase sigma factor [Lachnospiraceae bacterium]|nr:RNA polymerase sigma factor [Lachnospiraceae bacterium]